MKRSKAIEKIFKRLGPIGISEPTCEEILDTIEHDIGMSPPYDASSDDEDLDCCNWEPED